MPTENSPCEVIDVKGVYTDILGEFWCLKGQGTAAPIDNVPRRF